MVGLGLRPYLDSTRKGFLVRNNEQPDPWKVQQKTSLVVLDDFRACNDDFRTCHDVRACMDEFLTCEDDSPAMKPAASGEHSVSETPSGGRLSRYILAA